MQRARAAGGPALIELICDPEALTPGQSLSEIRGDDAGGPVRGAAEIAELVGRGELDPVAVVEEALERIAGDADLNAIMVTDGERALGRARAGVSGRLAGVPLLVKDLIDVAGLRTSFGSKIYAERDRGDDRAERARARGRGRDRRRHHRPATSSRGA